MAFFKNISNAFAKMMGRDSQSLAKAKTDSKTQADPAKAKKPEKVLVLPSGTRVRQSELKSAVSSTEVIDSIRQGLSEIPPLPQVVIQILRELQNPNSTARSVARIVQSDPALAAAILRTVNSALYGLRRQISSVDEAVAMLGYSTVRSLVIRLKLDESMPTAGGGIYDADDLWIHAMAVAEVADILARRVPGVDRGFVSTFGLLHDIGKMAVNSKFPETLREAWDQSRGNDLDTFLVREIKIFGQDHAHLGGMLAEQWNLPEELCEAIRSHHNLIDIEQSENLTPDQQRAIYLVHLSNQLAKYCYVYCEDMEIDPIPPHIFEVLGLPEDMEELLDARIRGAISRSIFFAEERSNRPVTVVRRALTLSRGVKAIKLGMEYEVTASADHRIMSEGRLSKFLTNLVEGDYIGENDDDPCAVISLIEDDGEVPDADELIAFNSCMFEAYGDKRGVEFLIAGACNFQKALRLRAEVILPARFAVRRVMANLLSFEQPKTPIRVIQTIRDKRLLLAFRSDMLKFENRLGEACSKGEAKGLMAAEFGNLLNLGWFAGVEFSPTGDTIVLVSDMI